MTKSVYWEKGLIIEQDPDDKVDYNWVWANFLPTGVTVSTATFTATGITVTGGTISGTDTPFRVEGGTNGIDYNVECDIVCSDTQEFSRSITIRVSEQ